MWIQTRIYLGDERVNYIQRLKWSLAGRKLGLDGWEEFVWSWRCRCGLRFETWVSWSVLMGWSGYE